MLETAKRVEVAPPQVVEEMAKSRELYAEEEVPAMMERSASGEEEPIPTRPALVMTKVVPEVEPMAN
jgi:hypothetical protein